MAIYHLSASIISRSAGRSSTAAAAYRSGERIVDERTGEIHDYTRKRGVVHAEVVLPESHPSWAVNRHQLWNAVEAKNKRKDAQVARDVTIALPKELSAADRCRLAVGFAQEIAEEYSIAIDVAIHAPSGGNDNHHAHLLMTTNTLTVDGLGNKCRAFDNIAVKRAGGADAKNAIEYLRESWEKKANQSLEQSGVVSRIDHRSLEAQGLNRIPTIHLGPKSHQMEQRGEVSERGLLNRAIMAANQEIKELGQSIKILGERLVTQAKKSIESLRQEVADTFRDDHQLASAGGDLGQIRGAVDLKAPDPPQRPDTRAGQDLIKKLKAERQAKQKERALERSIHLSRDKGMER